MRNFFVLLLFPKAKRVEKSRKKVQYDSGKRAKENSRCSHGDRRQLQRNKQTSTNNFSQKRNLGFCSTEVKACRVGEEKRALNFLLSLCDVNTKVWMELQKDYAQLVYKKNSFKSFVCFGEFFVKL